MRDTEILTAGKNVILTGMMRDSFENDGGMEYSILDVPSL